VKTAKKNIAVLAGCQALLFTSNSTAIALSGLAGYALATNKALATLPVTAWVVGGALTTFPASLLMKRIGRRAGFTAGALTGIVWGCDLCACALPRKFLAFCLGAMLYGVCRRGPVLPLRGGGRGKAGFQGQGDFPRLRGRAGGRILGPETSKLTVNLLPVTTSARIWR
jgi:hypothetical protein